MSERRYEKIRVHPHARKRMRQRKISRAQVERTVQRPDRTGESWGKLVSEGKTSAGNTVYVYHVDTDVDTAPDETLVLSVKRQRGISEQGTVDEVPQEGSEP